MNFKSMLLSTILLTNLAYNQTEASTQITSDPQFQGIVAQGKAVIAVADQQDTRIVGVIAELNNIQGQFPSVKFCYAIAQNVPQSVRKYGLGGFLIAVFNNGSCIARIQGTVSKSSLVSQLKSLLG